MWDVKRNDPASGQASEFGLPLKTWMSVRYLCLGRWQTLIQNGEMSEWLSASAAMPLRRDISPQPALDSHAGGGG